MSEELRDALAAMEKRLMRRINENHESALDDRGGLRDDVTILTAICMRVEAAVTALTTEVCAMHSRHARLERRVTKLEGGDDAAAAE